MAFNVIFTTLMCYEYWANSKGFSRSTYTAIHSLLAFVPIFSVIAETNVVPFCGIKSSSNSLNLYLTIVSALLNNIFSIISDTQLSKYIGLNAFFLLGFGIGTCSACF